MWILEVAQYNAYVLYALSRPQPDNNRKKKTSFRQFKRQLMFQLCEVAAIEVPSRKEIVQPAVGQRGKQKDPTMIERQTGQHLPLFDDRDRACKHCSKPGKRVRTHFYCSGCATKTYLHPKQCFFEYHTKK